MADLNTEIQTAVSEPARARDGAIEVQQRSVSDLIAADKHLRKTSRKSPLAGMFRFKIKPGRPGGLP